MDDRLVTQSLNDTVNEALADIDQEVFDEAQERLGITAKNAAKGAEATAEGLRGLGAKTTILGEAITVKKSNRKTRRKNAAKNRNRLRGRGYTKPLIVSKRRKKR